MRPMFSDVGQPKLVDVTSGEISADKMVMDRKGRLNIPSTLHFMERAMDSVFFAEAVYAFLVDVVTLTLQLVCDEPVTVFRVVLVDAAYCQ